MQIRRVNSRNGQIRYFTSSYWLIGDDRSCYQIAILFSFYLQRFNTFFGFSCPCWLLQSSFLLFDKSLLFKIRPGYLIFILFQSMLYPCIFMVLRLDYLFFTNLTKVDLVGLTSSVLVWHYLLVKSSLLKE